MTTAVVVQALVYVVTGLLLASHDLKPDARVIGVVDKIDPQVSRLNGLREVHDRHGGSVEDPEFNGGVVNVAELPHLVGEVIGVHQADGGGEGKCAVSTKNSLNSESPEVKKRKLVSSKSYFDWKK